MKWKKDNKLPNTKNVRRKTNPAGVTTTTATAAAANPKSGAKSRGGGKTQNATSANNNDKRKNNREMDGLGENMLDMSLSGEYVQKPVILLFFSWLGNVFCGRFSSER